MEPNCIFREGRDSCIHVGFAVDAEGTQQTLPIIVFERKLFVRITDNHLAIIIGLFSLVTLKSQLI